MAQLDSPEYQDLSFLGTLLVAHTVPNSDPMALKLWLCVRFGSKIHVSGPHMFVHGGCPVISDLRCVAALHHRKSKKETIHDYNLPL